MTTPSYKTSLRTRIILALVLIATMTSTLLAVSVLLIKGQLEQIIFDDMVREQLQILLPQVENGTYAEDNLFRNWKFYFNESVASAHPVLRSLPSGSHHRVLIDEHYYQVEVGEHLGQPVFLTYDITAWENQENLLLSLLAYGIGVVFVVAFLLGRQASISILAPVNALTARLVSIHPRQRNVRIAKDFKGNEIGLIARAFDQYLERLDRFVERERSFTAAASHELRTPLSVMMGAVDVLDSQVQTSIAQRALIRVRRACDDMRAFIEATLFLSREDSNTIHEGNEANVGEIIRRLLEDSQPFLQERNIHVTATVPTDFVLEQSVSIVQIMIGNILRNAIEHTQNGSIDIRITDRELMITDSGIGIAAEDLPFIFERSYTTKKSGTGMGLNLVKHICDRFNWQIRIESMAGQGTTANIRF